MTGYQVVGHHKSIDIKDCSSRTLSDGKIFLDRARAEAFASANMHNGYTIKQHENITNYWDHDRAQFYHIQKQEWI